MGRRLSLIATLESMFRNEPYRDGAATRATFGSINGIACPEDLESSFARVRATLSTSSSGKRRPPDVVPFENPDTYAFNALSPIYDCASQLIQWLIITPL